MVLYEFFVNQYDNSDNITKRKIPEECKNNVTNSIEFTFDGEIFGLNTEYIHNNYFTDRTDNISKKTFEKGTNLNLILSYIIDKDRYVKATTNNPNSSRSHSLIILKFLNQNKQEKDIFPILILGDFAGVENKFNCEDKDFLKKLNEIKVDGKVDGKNFYEKYAIGIPQYSYLSNKNLCDPCSTLQESKCSPVEPQNKKGGIYIPIQSNFDDIDDNLKKKISYFSIDKEQFKKIERYIINLLSSKQFENAKQIEIC